MTAQMGLPDVTRRQVSCPHYVSKLAGK